MKIFCGVGGLAAAILFVLFFLEARRVVVNEMARIPEIQYQVEAEDIHDVNHALRAQRNAEMNAPRVLAFDARGKLAAWERGRR